MKAKTLLLNSLVKEKISHLFMVPGGLVDPFLTAFDEVPEITPIVAAHEGGAAYMADGYSRASGRFGACLGIGGPGAANMTTAVMTAKSDRSPVLIITGEVSSSMEGLGGFQDASIGALDDFDILKPATNLSVYVENEKLFNLSLRRCLEAMKGSTQGPVHLCIPKDIQESEQQDHYIQLDEGFAHPRILDVKQTEKVMDQLEGPLTAILAGSGVDSSGAQELLKEVSERFSIPVVTTLRAKGVISEKHKNSLGVFGYSGTHQATELLTAGACDNLIVLGSGLNQRDTMFWSAKLMPKHCFASINLTLDGYDTTYSHIKPIEGDCFTFLEYLLNNCTETLEKGAAERQEWINRIRTSSPRFYDEENCRSNAVPIHPARIVRDLRKIAPEETILLIDSGAHRAFFGHYWESYGPGQYISATNLGPMGWAIPASIGVKCARPEAPVVCITGDGCMLMHGIEIQTAARYKLPIIFVILNNAAYGNVYLRAAKEGSTPAALTSLPNHDWVAFANALGLKAVAIDDPNQLSETYEWAFEQQEPVVLDIKCSKTSSTPVSPFQESQKAWSYHD